MIIWSRWGILVVVFAFIGVVGAVMGAEALSTSLHLAQPIAPTISLALGLILTAGQNYAFTRWRERGEPQIFIEEATGQRIEVRPNAGSLFFIPMRYWTWIALGLAAFIAATSIYSQFS